MAIALFDTLEYVKLLTQADFNQKQAEALNGAQMIAMQALLTQVATHANFQDLRVATHNDMQNLRAETHRDMQNLRTEIKDVEHRLEKKIDAIKPFVYKVMVSIMLSNLTIIGIGVGIIALIVK
ncbi:MAG: hypothetical protein ABSF18_02570 [Gammaproteobacteria bacterium]|jgi:hypothetical protein